MSFVEGLFSGDKGANFKAQGSNIVEPFNKQDTAEDRYRSVLGIDQQEAFLHALEAQNGIQNQSQVFAQQQALAGQLQDAANGGGPNPALAQLAQTTGQNVASQAALMAGQRGVGANPALLARQIGQQGAGIQQNAAGQAATLAAQQQIAARQQLQQQQAMLQALAGAQVGQQSGALNDFNRAAQSEQANVLGAVQGQNNANVANVNGQNSANASIAGINAKAQNDMVSGVLNAGGSALMMAKGGQVPQKFADGGQAQPNLGVNINIPTPPMAAGPQHPFSQFLYDSAPKAPGAAEIMPQAPTSVTPSGSSEYQAGQSMGNAAVGGIKSLIGGSGTPMADGMSAPALGSQFAGAGYALAKGGQVPGYDEGGSVLGSIAKIAPLLMLLSKGGPVNGEQMAAQGKEVPGKAKVKGDSPKNDTVDAKLSPGEIVIPRSIAQGPNAAANAAKFVEAVLAKKGRRGL